MIASNPTMERRQIIRTAESWLQADLANRANFVLMSESEADGYPHGSAAVGGNPALMIDSLVNAMLKDPAVANIVADAVEVYNAEKIQMN